MTEATTKPKLGDTRPTHNNEDAYCALEIFTVNGWRPFVCNYCDSHTDFDDKCPKCGADYTIDTDELVHGERMR